MFKKKIIVICGPTASGKTEISLSLAKKLNTEIISADSMNVYRGLNIGTAKPSESERREVKHHLIDVVSPLESFSVGDYKEIAKPIVDGLLNEFKIPIICGGTGFYINSILYDFSYGKVKGDIVVRQKYLKMAEEKGADAVYQVLVDKDPFAAKTLHPNDVKRVVRALEICENGIKKSDIKDELRPVYDYSAYALDFEREDLYERIDKRVDNMVSNGLIAEVESLIENGVNENCQCMQGIGYKEIYEYLKNGISLDEAIEKIKLNTRHYAKRQITFFKRLPRLIWLKPDTVDTITERIVNEI